MKPQPSLLNTVRQLAAQSYVEFKHLKKSGECWLHGFKTLIFHQYHSGNSISKYLSGGLDVAVIQAGPSGPLYVVTKLEHFLEIAQQSEQHISQTLSAVNDSIQENQNELC